MRATTSRVRLGLIGTILIITTIVTVVRLDRVPLLQDGFVAAAQFSEAGGLKSGDDVIVAGMRVGSVDSLTLDGDRVEITYRVEDASSRLGMKTKARIVTTTLLGEAALELVPDGAGELGDGDVIPLARTSSPYDVTSALSELTTTVEEIDVDQLARSLSTAAETFADTPEDLRPALEGISAVTEALNSRQGALTNLVQKASNVTEVLASRNAEVSKLITSGESLLAQLDAQRALVESLLDGAVALADQLQAFVRENGKALKPALDNLTKVIKILNRNKDDLQAAITGARDYTVTFGEAVSSGPFFDAYIQNLTSPATLAPIISGALK